MQKKDPNYDYFIKADLTEYENEWVAISGSKVVAHGKKANLVYKKAREKKPRAKINLAKVLSKKPMIFGIF